MRSEFFIEVGIDLDNGWRQCVWEVGPFEDFRKALELANDLRDKPAATLSYHPLAERYEDIVHYDVNEIMVSPLKGVTLLEITHDDGTIWSSDLY